MSFTPPVWVSTMGCYKVSIIQRIEFEYNEYRDKSSGNFLNEPDVESQKFLKVIGILADRLHEEGKNWFSSPIKQQIFLKRVIHKFTQLSHINNSHGTNYKFTWVPATIFIQPSKFEIVWESSVELNKIPTNVSNAIEFSEELTGETPTRTIVIQSNPAELEIIGNDVIPFDTSEQEMKLSSRAIFKQKVREARLKAAFSTMKAERMAEKYFRRYGIHGDFEYESELSFSSDDEESEEE